MLTELNRHADEDSSGPGLRNRKKGEKQQQQPQEGTLEKRETGGKEGKNEDGDKQSESEQEDEGEDEDEEEVVNRGVKHEFSLPEIRVTNFWSVYFYVWVCVCLFVCLFVWCV